MLDKILQQPGKEDSLKHKLNGSDNFYETSNSSEPPLKASRARTIREFKSSNHKISRERLKGCVMKRSIPLQVTIIVSGN